LGQGESDPELKLAEKEEVIIQNVFQIDNAKFLIFPFDE